MFKLDTIHGKFIKYTLLLLIVPSSIFLTSYFYSLRKDVIADAYTDINDEVTNQQTAISGWLTHHEDLLKFVASSPNIVQQPETMRSIFQAFLAAHNGIRSIIFFDKHGGVKENTSPTTDVNVADREYFIRARNGQATTTSPIVSRLSGEYIVIMSQPVYGNAKEFEGVITAAISFKTLLEEFSLSETNNSARPYLIDAQSQTFLSNMDKNKAQTIIPPQKADDAPHSYINSNGVRVLGVSVPINDGKWHIAIERPYSSILGRMDSFLLQFAFGLLLSIAILFPLIKKYISTVVKPIETISTLSTEFSHNISNAGCPYINTNNMPQEIVLLYHNFCEMAKKLSLYVQELKESSLTDPLTGLANRRCLEKDGCKLIEICRRSGVTCCCLVLDLDHFKHVNDTYGHQTGDVALQTVSTILKNNTRTSDICARFGGDEFTILASSTTAEAAMCLAEKIRAEVEKTPIAYGAFTFNITVSIGIAEIPQENHSCSSAMEEGIRAADCAMYTAKKTGRNRVVQWSGEQCDTA